ncbi:hypothetical protein FB565_003075 [Actinoplanes lutulentus]|uniref:PucR-like helix-turn-helix protein n=1 Tax=Actinoplanes lutulentus TaxID=1287878 RepID=A0A327Z1K8_9ACTN|nr:helix-turn-helix domain-containing protein [Actinoplanes lutulentus]MBB2943362.1 hypothetical protein [Actinoplanes lutulentus]RAK28420.1 PucR-like helix-turn-helix protein [Actinoplanes lutulentus]
MAGSLTIEGTPAPEWVRAHRRTLSTHALQALSDHGAEASRPAAPRRDPELRWIVEHNVDLFMLLLDRGPGGELTDEEAADLIASAARRASDGEPVEHLLIDYQIGADAMWQVIAPRCRAGERDGLLRITEAVHRYLRQVTGFVVRGFQHEAARMRLGERDARYGLFSALLSGQSPQAAAELAGIALPPGYLVLSLHLGPDPTPPAAPPPGRSPRVSAHRRSNTVQRVLDQYGTDVLALVRDPVATALIPVAPDAGTAEARLVVDRLTEALGVPVHAGAAFGPPDTVHLVHQQGNDVLEIALAAGHGPGAYTLDDVLVAYQLTRPGPGTDRLRERLRPLDGHPDWEQTLRTFLRNGFDRQRTAADLHVHPNTVDYRLTRIAVLVGFDPTEPAQRLTAFAALYLRDLDRYRRRSGRALVTSSWATPA